MSRHQHVQIFADAGGQVLHVYTTTGRAPARAMIEAADADGAPVALTLHEVVLSGDGERLPRVVRAGELRAALEVDQGKPRMRADAPAELRALRLETRPAREIGR